MQIYLCWLFFITKLEQRLQLRATHFSCIRRARHSLAPPTQFHSFARSPLLVACGMPNVLCGCILIEIFLYLHTLTVLYRNCYSTLIYILFYTYVCVCVAACVYHVADISAAIVLFAVDELHFAHVHPLPFAFHAAAPRCAACWLSWFKVQQKTLNAPRPIPFPCGHSAHGQRCAFCCCFYFLLLQLLLVIANFMEIIFMRSIVAVLLVSHCNFCCGCCRSFWLSLFSGFNWFGTEIFYITWTFGWRLCAQALSLCFVYVSIAAFVTALIVVAHICLCGAAAYACLPIQVPLSYRAALHRLLA